MIGGELYWTQVVVSVRSVSVFGSDVHIKLVLRNCRNLHCRFHLQIYRIQRVGFCFIVFYVVFLGFFRYSSTAIQRRQSYIEPVEQVYLPSCLPFLFVY